MKIVICINDKIYKGEVELDTSSEGTISVVGACDYMLNNDPEKEQNRIFEDYQILGWEK